jgi:hypothetical protein
MADAPRGVWTARNDDVQRATAEKFCIETISAVCNPPIPYNHSLKRFKEERLAG